MRVVISTEAWPEKDGTLVSASTVRALVQVAWTATNRDVTLDVFATGGGGPRWIDDLPGKRVTVGGAEAVETEQGMVLGPNDGETRWNPSDLAAALLGLGASAERDKHVLPVIVPLGDEPPAGDAADLWGGSLEAMRFGTRKLALRALVGSQRPLLGFKGMAAHTMLRREHDPAIATAAQEQERRWADIARAGDALAARTTLLGPSRLSDAPGSGAAGGLAYCLAAFGAELTAGSAFVADVAHLHSRLEGADVAVAIAGSGSHADLDEGSVAPMAEEAARLGIPCVLVAPAVDVGKRGLMAAGVSAAFAAGEGLDALESQVARVAQTWTPAR